MTESEVGKIYKIANFAQGVRREAHGDRSWRPHGVVMSSPDGLVNVVPRSSKVEEYNNKRDFWSPKVPAMELDKDGFFSAESRWYKSFSQNDLKDARRTRCLGHLPEPQLGDFVSWTEAL